MVGQVEQGLMPDVNVILMEPKMSLNAHISEKTPLIDALMTDDKSFDRLRQGLGEFSRLSHVLVKEDVARELSLGDVAWMIGVPVADLTRLAGGGAVSASRVQVVAELSFSDAQAGDPVDFGDDGACWIDVRPILRDGHEPLMSILRAAKTLEPTQDLVVVTTFHAEPLRRLLGYRGFVSFAEKLASDHWRIRFRHQAPGTHGTAGACCGSCGGR